MKTFLFAIFFLIAGTLFSAAGQSPIHVGMIDSYKNEVLKLSSKPIAGYSQTLLVSKCPPLDSPLLKDIQRNTIELMFVCHAIKEAGLADKLILKSYPNPKRLMLMIESGDIDIDGDSKFKVALANKNLLVSDTLIRKGEFEVGLFTTANRPEVLKIKTKAELLERIGVTVKSWKMDRAVMEQLNPKQLRFVGKGSHIYRAIHSKKGDFTFSYLKKKTVDQGEGALVRIEGFKASLPDARVKAISTKRQDIYQAIQQYIKKSRKPVDLIKKAYIHSGFIALDYENWIDVRLAK
jgi:hypothetical protein